jgi:hypothetical protein
LWTESEALLNAANQERNHLDSDFDELPVFEALDSEATFDRAVIDGNELDADIVPGSPEEEAILGMPGMLSSQQMAELLREYRAEQAKRLTQTSAELSLSEQMSLLRRELQECVKAYARQTNSTPIAVNAEIKRALGGLPAPMASANELRERIELVRSWAVSQRRF